MAKNAKKDDDQLDIETGEGETESAKKGSRAKADTRTEGETAPVGITADQCLEMLKTGDTSGLENCPPDELANVRVPFKEWARAEGKRIESMYDVTYAAILGEMARKGVTY